MRINGKSRELLERIMDLLSRKQLSINTFPEQDVIDMVKIFYLEEKERREEACQTGIAYLEDLFLDAVTEQKEEELLDILKVIINVELEEWQQFLEPRYLVKECTKNVKEMYRKYGRTAQGDNAFCGKGVIYTVITGNYDVLQEPEYIDEKYKYICFTDNPDLKSSVWEIRLMDNSEKLDNVRFARKYKIMCWQYLSEYDYSIYIDGKMKIRGDLAEYIRKYSKGSAMLCFPHFVRECAYEEEKACAQLGKDNEALMAEQMKGYKEEGYPVNYGLIDSACLVRLHHDEKLQKVLSDWWYEVKTKSRRDQLSFGYACWKNAFEYDICDLLIYENSYIYGGGHVGK